ncbi:MAG: ABC transporter permease subunit [Alphaproteobacteria bacterium]|jgi:polar amino acid transport system permease protein|nr:ABC transporter permease [Rhodospirillaceae bacterium]MDP6404388.1 ABC transporter permease subunit [Alphaproteobacteria bacterium]MDP6621325.1 ABC transporter permease subunit [Alphaproteobacteria bacterium]|tara:strand:+ start:1070 stop:1756 length:687 start_codon:yes stop_codon:yes gene_type:complete
MELHGFGGQLAIGLSMTVRVALAAVVVGLVLGLIGAAMKLSGSRTARAVAGGYTTIIRGVPELLLLLILFFGGTMALQKIFELLGHDEYVEVSAFGAGVATLGFVFGAYATEVFRGAILAVPPGQIDAARAVGMGRLLTFRRILLPQVWRFALPGLGNLWMVLLKDTALISVIGLDEIMRKATIASGATREPFTFYAAAALIFLGLTIVSMAALQYAENRAGRGFGKL